MTLDSTLHLPPGTHGVVGPNSAGKTHLLEHVHASTPHSAYAPAAHHALFAGHSVAEHFACAAVARESFDRDLARHVIGDLDERTPLRRLSTGDARLLTLASALASRAPILLLDEPFDGLDITHRTRLRTILIDLLADHIDILVLTSHRAEDLTGLVDTLITVTDRTAGPVALDDLRSCYPTATGQPADVDKQVGDHEVLASSVLGGRVRTTYHDPAGTDSPNVEFPDDVALINLLASHGIRPR